MECKYRRKTSFWLGFTELIDTLWNVNLLSAAKASPITIELIDTLWNVNI